MTLILSDHAELRTCQRSINDIAIEAALSWGILKRQIQGRMLFFIGDRSVQDADREGVDIKDSKGVGVVMAADGIIVSVFKSSNLKKVRWRSK